MGNQHEQRFGKTHVLIAAGLPNAPDESGRDGAVRETGNQHAQDEVASKRADQPDDQTGEHVTRAFLRIRGYFIGSVRSRVRLWEV